MTTYTYLTTYRYQPSVIRIIDEWYSEISPHLPTKYRIRPMRISPLPDTIPWYSEGYFEVWSQWRESENE